MILTFSVVLSGDPFLADFNSPPDLTNRLYLSLSP